MGNPLDDKVLIICQKIKFFKDIEVSDLPKVVQNPSIKKYKAGEVIIKEGEINREFYYCYPKLKISKIPSFRTCFGISH